MLYSAGYVHRDLSLGNLIYCSDGNCKLSDFEYAMPYEYPPGSAVKPAGTSYGVGIKTVILLFPD